MKTCQCCGGKSPADAPSCPFCGECSFMPLALPAVEPPRVWPDAPAAPDEPARRKPGRPPKVPAPPPIIPPDIARDPGASDN